MMIGSFFTGENFIEPWWFVFFYLSGLLVVGAVVQTLIWSRKQP
jgi:hypothetical protein